MFYNNDNNAQNLNNNIKETQIEIQNNQNNNFNDNMFDNNTDHSNKNNNIFNSATFSLNLSPNIKNVENPKNQNLYEEAKEKQIKEIEKELENIWQDRLLAQNAFDKCLQLLRCAYINNYKDVNDYFKKTENSLEILKIKTKELINKAKELINFAQNLKYKKDLKDLFEEYVTQSNLEGFNLTMQEIIELMNNVLQIKHKALNKILKNSNHNAKIIEKKLKENTTKLIKFCTDFNPYLMELSNNFTNIKLSEESYILETFETFNKTLEIREKMLEYIKSNILNLENELKNMISSKENMQDLLNKKIEEKSDEEKAKKEELNENEEPEVKLTKKEEQKIISDLKKINCYNENTFENEKKEKIKLKIIEREKNKLDKLKGHVMYYNEEWDSTIYGRVYHGHYSPSSSRGMEKDEEELEINLEYLINIYTNKPYKETEKMLEIITKSYRKLKNKIKKYVKLAKNLKYKEKILNLYELKVKAKCEIKPIIKFKKQIDELKNRILEKIKNSPNKEKTEQFKRMLIDLTAILINDYDETTLNIYKTIEKGRDISDKNKYDRNKYIDELLDAIYNTILCVNQKTIKYLSSIFNDYKDLNL